MNDKLRDLLKHYDDELAEVFQIKRCQDRSLGCHHALPHVRWMIQAMLSPSPALVEKFKDEREVNRWLGFIQGVLWSYNGDFDVWSLTTLRAQTRKIFGDDAMPECE